MKRKILNVLFITVLLINLASLGLAQTQTGSIRGAITDEEGNPLPGVMVTITSPAMMGTQSFVSTAKGDFRFPACPPGEYTVKAELTGFQTVERPGVILHVGTTVDVDFIMKPTTLEEEITVTAPSPMVDTKSSKLSVPITTEMIKNVPMSRDIYDVVKTAPSFVEEGPAYRKMGSVHGGTIYHNKYSIDGTDITDPYQGYITMGVAFDAIEEVEMVTGGHGAEVGLTAAGYINVVSKSGGNTFSGGFTAQYTSEKFQSSTIPDNELDAMGFGAPLLDKYNYDLSFTLGGPIIKDRLWFFLNPQWKQFKTPSPFIPFTDPFGRSHDPYDFEKKDYGGFFKLTAQITQKLKYMGMWQYLAFYGDPQDIFTRWDITYEANIDQWDNAHTLSNVLTYIVNQDTYLEARFGYTRRFRELENNTEREGKDVAAYSDRATGRMWGGYLVNNEFYIRKKLNFGLSLTRYQDDFLGANHEFKAGVEYGRWRTKAEFTRKNPYLNFWFNGTPWYFHDTNPYMGLFYVVALGEKVGDSPEHATNWRWSFFAQDTVSIGKRLSLNVGLRFDSQHISRPEEYKKGRVDKQFNGLYNVLLPTVFPTEDQTAPEIKNFIVYNILQPRIGLTYDLFGNGKTALKASYSRYTELFIATMLGEIHPFTRQYVGFLWFDLDKDGFYDLPPVDFYSPLSIPRIIADPEEYKKQFDPDLSAPYIDEITAGIQHELIQNFSLGLNFIYKVNRNIPETIDTANPFDGDMWLPYTVTDPGNDETLGTGDDKELTVFALKQDAESPFLYRTNIEELKRKYWGVELVLFKRMSNNWQLAGSVTYSKQYGNIGGGWYDNTGSTMIYTDPNNLINNWGRLTWDRPLIVKLMGTVILPYGINLSAYFRHFSGPLFTAGAYGSPLNRTVTVYFPSTVNGFPVKSPMVTVNADPPGSRRSKASDFLDIRIEKEFYLGFGRLGAYLDFYNLLGYSKISLDQNNGGYIFADGTFSRFPTFGRITLAEGVRVAKITLRFTF